MSSFACLCRTAARLGSALRPLGLLIPCLALALIIASPVVSQDDSGSDTELPYDAPPPCGWVTLDVTVDSQDSLTSDIGRGSVIPITITNDGNIAALGVSAIFEGGDLVLGTPVKVGDIPPAGVTSVDLPIEILGRSAFTLPFSVRVSAENVSHPTITTVEFSFAGLDTNDYLDASPDADLLWERGAQQHLGFGSDKSN